MKKSYVYTAVFMLIVTALFTASLAFTQAHFSPSIQKNKLVAEQRAMLEAFAIEPGTNASAVESTFKSRVKEAYVLKDKDDGDYTVYKLVSNDTSTKAEAYAIPFVGSGLWGTIRGYIALTPELNKIIGLTFTEQNETPGLGGRIEEDWYKDQFRGLAITDKLTLRYGDNGGQKLDAITGATQTSNAVIRILRSVIQSRLPALFNAMAH